MTLSEVSFLQYRRYHSTNNRKKYVSYCFSNGRNLSVSLKINNNQKYILVPSDSSKQIKINHPFNWFVLTWNFYVNLD